MKELSTYILIFLVLSSCSSEEKPKYNMNESAIEIMLETIIQNKSNLLVEFPSLSDSLISIIPEKSRLKISEILRKKGFKEIKTERGNLPPNGIRIVTKTLQRKDCMCEVSKIYNLTIHEGLYQTAERIICREAKIFE